MNIGFYNTFNDNLRYSNLVLDMVNENIRMIRKCEEQIKKEKIIRWKRRRFRK